MDKEPQIYDPNTNCVYTQDGELLQTGVTLRPIRSYEKSAALSHQQVDKMSEEEIKLTIRQMYRFDGVRIQKDFETKKRLLRLIKDKNIKPTDAMRIWTLYALLSSRQAVLFSQRKHCLTWKDLMKIDELQIQSQAALMRFTRILRKYNIANLYRDGWGDNRLILNPIYGYNNRILFRDTFFAFRSDIDIPYIAQRYFDLGYNSTISRK